MLKKLARNSFRSLCWACLLGWLANAVALAQEKPKAAPTPKVDLYGDPLPADALARFGTTRFRHSENLIGLTYSPDGKLLVTACERALFFWDAATGKLLKQVNVGNLRYGSYLFLCFSRDGKSIHTQTDRMEICTYKAPTGELIGDKFLLPKESNRDEDKRNVWLTPDEKRLIVIGSNKLYFYDFTTKKEIASNKCTPQAICELSPNGHRFVVAEGKRLTVYDTSTGKQLRSWVQTHKGNQTRALTITPDNTTLINATDEPALHFTDLETMKPVQKPVKVKDEHLPVSLTFSPDGKTLVANNDNVAISLLHPKTGAVLKKLSTNDTSSSNFTFTPDSKNLLIRNDSSSTCRFWNLESDKEIFPFGLGFTSGVVNIRWLPTGDSFIATDNLGQVWEWDRTSTRRSRELLASAAVVGVRSSALSPDGKMLVHTDNEDSGLELYNVTTGKKAGKLQDSASYYHLAWSPDGRWIAAGAEMRVDIFETRTKKLHKTLNVRSDASLNFTPDGTKLICQAQGNQQAPGSFCAFNTQTWSLAGQFTFQQKEDGYLTAISGSGGSFFSHAGKHLNCFEFTSGIRSLYFTKGELASLDSIVCSPNGQLLAITRHNDVVMYDAFTEKMLGRLKEHNSYISSVCFSPDGKYLLTGSEDTTLLLWDMQPFYAKLDRPVRKLTAQELADCWQDLQGADFKKVRAANLKLTMDPQAAVQFLAEKLKPVATADLANINRLVADLNHEEYAVRAKAESALLIMARQADTQLRQMQAAANTVQVRFLLQEILAGSESLLGPGESLTLIRGLHVLDMLHTADAKKLVEHLATGNSGTLETQTAKSILARWGK